MPRLSFRHRAPEVKVGPPLLLVEDDAPLRLALAEYVRTLGFEVFCAGDGDEALEMIIEDGLRPSVVVLDLSMPIMTGWELLSAFDRSQPLLEIPCVVITGMEPHGLDARARTTVLRKPFALSDLVGALRRWTSAPSPAAP